MANQPLTAEQFAPCDAPQAPSGRSSIKALSRTSAVVAVLGVGVANGKIGAPQRRPAATASLAPTHLSGQSEVHRPPGSSVLSRHHNGEGKQSVAERWENNQLLTQVVVVPSDKEIQVLRRSVVPPDSQISAAILRRRGPRIALVLVIVTVLSAGFSLAPSALADSVANLKDAMAQARGGTSCGPLRSDPVVEQVAERINRSTNDWLDHTATQVPIEDPLPGLKILGYGGSKAKLLQGAARTDADAIKGTLLEGLDAIPNCSYTDFGASMLRNEASDHYLTAVVLAGV